MATAALTAPASQVAPVARYTGRREHGELSAALRDENPGVRAKALFDLGRLGEQGAEQLGHHEKAFFMLEDPSTQVRAAAATALGCMGRYGATFADYLAARLSSPGDLEVKRASARALGNLGELASAQSEALEKCMDEADDADLIAAACAALGAVRATHTASRLVEKLSSCDVEVVVAACRGLSFMPPAGLDELIDLLDSPEVRVRTAAAAAIARSPGAVPSERLGRITDSVADAEVQVRMSAVAILSATGSAGSAQTPRLGELLEHEDPGVRAAAATALGGIGGAGAAAEILRLERLLTERDEDKSSHVLTIAGLQSRVPPVYRKPSCAAAATLAVLGAAAHRSAGKVADNLDSFDEELRVQCACALAGLGKSGAQHEDRVLALLDDPQPMVVAAACYSLGSMAEATGMPSPTVANRVADHIKDRHPAVRGAAVGGLGKMGEEAPAHVEAIARCLQDRVGYVRMQAVEALVGCGETGEMFAGQICRAMFDVETKVRLSAIAALPRLGERGAAFAEEVAALADDQQPEVRAACVKALGDFRNPELAYHLPAILQLAEADGSELVREAARGAATAMQAALEDEPRGHADPRAAGALRDEDEEDDDSGDDGGVPSAPQLVDGSME